MAEASAPITVDVVRVFCDEREEHGNPLGIVRDSSGLDGDRARQALAAELGFSETVFVEDADTAALRIFTPQVELPLAGHPLVGAAWLLREDVAAGGVLRPPAGPVACGASTLGAWIEADPELAPDWAVEQLGSPDEVDAVDAGARGDDAHDYVWAWEDEDAGRIRARCFAGRVGIEEDEATGSAALRLGREVERIVTIRQGRGSIIQVVPQSLNGLVRIGGRVVTHDRITVDPV